MSKREPLTPAQVARMQTLWEGSPDLTALVIGERFGVSKNTVIGQAARGQWTPRGTSRARTRPVKQKPTFTGKRMPTLYPARLEARLSESDMASMRGLWDAGTPISHIARQFGVADSSVRGLAERLEWWPYPTEAELTAPDPPTLHDRMDAEHARMDAVLAETEATIAAAKRRAAVQMAGAAG